MSDKKLCDCEEPRIGIEVRGMYDGVLVLWCKECHKLWSRFSCKLLWDKDREPTDEEWASIQEDANQERRNVLSKNFT